MTRAAYRFRAFTIGPNLEPDAEAWTFAMQCTTCHESSEPSQEIQDAQDWAEAHLKANPDHRHYREHVTRPYRAVPGAWQ